MKTLFDPNDCQSLCARIRALEPSRGHLWGKMNVSQMLCHCGRPLEGATGERPMKQSLIGKILARFVLSSVFSEKPFGKGGPTAPSFVVADERDFATEQTRLLTLIDRFVQRGAVEVGKEPHVFFGKLTGEQWGQLMYKHIDHHLQQFGA